MSDADIQRLKEAVERGEVIWICGPEARIVHHVTTHADEPSEIAVFTGIGTQAGNYVALYNCTLSDFVEARPIQ